MYRAIQAGLPQRLTVRAASCLFLASTEKAGSLNSILSGISDMKYSFGTPPPISDMTRQLRESDRRLKTIGPVARTLPKSDASEKPLPMPIGRHQKQHSGAKDNDR